MPDDYCCATSLPSLMTPMVVWVMPTPVVS
jgi:hypothetical protein